MSSAKFWGRHRRNRLEPNHHRRLGGGDEGPGGHRTWGPRRGVLNGERDCKAKGRVCDDGDRSIVSGRSVRLARPQVKAPADRNPFKSLMCLSMSNKEGAVQGGV